MSATAHNPLDQLSAVASMQSTIPFEESHAAQAQLASQAVGIPTTSMKREISVLPAPALIRSATAQSTSSRLGITGISQDW